MQSEDGVLLTEERMKPKVITIAAALVGASLWLAAGAEAADLSGSISLGKRETRSETTVTVSPDGGTVTTTTRTETRGGAFDISIGRDRRHKHGSRHPYGHWETRRGPVYPRYPAPRRYEPRPPYYGVPRYEPIPPRYPVYGTVPPSVTIGVPAERTEVRREVITIRPPVTVLPPVAP
jgi:hypothetical protein